MKQNRPSLRGQRGQSMSELLISMAALLPIFLAITYAARYGDLQQRATQASRYAAFQRAMEPDTGRLSDARLQDQMRARFFLAPLQLNQGRLQSDDSAARITNDAGQSPLWRDLGHKALLESPQQVRLSWSSQALGSNGVNSTARALASTMGKHYRNTQVAQVELTLFNRMDQTRPGAPALRLGAATAAAGDGLGSAGSQATRDTAASVVPAAHLPSALKGLLERGVGLLERRGPELGCIKPDVVPAHRLKGAPNNSRCL